MGFVWLNTHSSFDKTLRTHGNADCINEMNFRLSTQDSHVNFINISQGMLSQPGWTFPSHPQGTWGQPPGSGAGNAICSEQMMDQQPSLWSCLNHVNSTKVAPENLSLVHVYGQRQSPRCLTGPCSHQLNQTLQISHNLQTAWRPSTWLTLLGRNNPYYLFFFFTTSLRLCSQTPSTATQWEFMGRS